MKGRKQPYDTAAIILRKGAVSARAGERLLIPINMRDGEPYLHRPQREQDKARRGSWGTICPVTRTPNPKAYHRKKARHEEKVFNAGPSFIFKFDCLFRSILHWISVSASRPS